MEGQTSTKTALPVAITRFDDGLLVRWPSGQPPQWLPARELRLRCPCAFCVEELSGRPLLDPDSVPADIRPVALSLVGAYGLRVQWSDGHATGIYTFAWLLAQPPGEPPPR
jgi:DUF971 family protein